MFGGSGAYNVHATFQNAGMVLSIGVFFSLIVAGLGSSLPHTLDAGLTGQGVPAPAAHAIAQLPPEQFAAYTVHSDAVVGLRHGGEMGNDSEILLLE